LRAAPDSNIDKYLRVRLSKLRQERPAPDYRLEASRKIWAPTYFPNSLDKALASSIRIRGGEDLQGCDIHLPQSTAYRIRGVVLDENGHGAHALIKLKSADTQDMTLGRPGYAEIDSDEDGSFEFPTVGSGHWRLIAAMKDFKGERRGFAAVFVTRYDLEDIRIQLHAPFLVTGRAEGPPSKADRPAQFHLVPVDGPVEQEVYSGSLKDGEMRAEAYPGRYRALVGTPVGSYLNSILFEHRDVLDQEIELSAAPLPLVFVYRADGGRLRGIVENGNRAAVILIPRNESWFVKRLFLYQVRCDESGHYSINDIRPGDYYAFALSQMDGSLLYSPTAFTIFGNIATRVTVERDTETVLDLKLQVWPEWGLRAQGLSTLGNRRSDSWRRELALPDRGLTSPASTAGSAEIRAASAWMDCEIPAEESGSGALQPSLSDHFFVAMPPRDGAGPLKNAESLLV
jgi:hypothetical protein